MAYVLAVKFIVMSRDPLGRALRGQKVLLTLVNPLHLESMTLDGHTTTSRFLLELNKKIILGETQLPRIGLISDEIIWGSLYGTDFLLPEPNTR